MKEESPFEWLYYLTLVTQLGFVVVVTILVGFGIGYFIDKKTDTSPVFTVIFLVIGIAGGLFNAYQMIMRKLK